MTVIGLASTASSQAETNAVTIAADVKEVFGTAVGDGEARLTDAVATEMGWRDAKVLEDPPLDEQARTAKPQIRTKADRRFDTITSNDCLGRTT